MKCERWLNSRLYAWEGRSNCLCTTICMFGEQNHNKNNKQHSADGMLQSPGDAIWFSYICLIWACDLHGGIQRRENASIHKATSFFFLHGNSFGSLKTPMPLPCAVGVVDKRKKKVAETWKGTHHLTKYASKSNEIEKQDTKKGKLDRKRAVWYIQLDV